MTHIAHHIGGARITTDALRQPVVDPATGQQIGEVELADAALVDRAVATAQEAAGPWGGLSLTKRQRVMFDYRTLLLERVDELAAVITREHGKTLDDAAGEIQRGIEVVEHLCSAPDLLKGGHSEQVSTGVDIHSARHPLGVVAGITPFNFPAMVPMWMFPVAIACGNGFILKPSERDPSASLLLAQWFEEAGLPPGVLNVVQGGREAAEAILAHQGIAAVSFVGSTPVARSIYENGARYGKRVQALGGAKNHMVVMPDADLDAAADAAVSAAFGSAGQRCMAVSAVVAVGGVGAELVGRITKRAADLRIGAGDQDVDMGPMITREARDRAVHLVGTGVEQGAELELDGRDLVDDEGFFLGPCLLTDVRPDMDVYREEIFGPVLIVLDAPTVDDALQLIDDNPYGNGVAIFTESGGVAREFQRRVSAGMVGVNVPIPVPLSFYSFGGWDDSLFGSSHIYGPEGVAFYTRGKVVTTRWTQTDGLQMGFAPPN
jgi:malonate-semialdehyde dehydrogenase (acetylating)/methylmalonate-semialdehyde dehydrogenase